MKTWAMVFGVISLTAAVAWAAGPPANPLRITRVQLPKKSTALTRRALRAAVSYTHLDVYKRQGEAMGVGFFHGVEKFFP